MTRHCRWVAGSLAVVVAVAAVAGCTDARPARIGVYRGPGALRAVVEFEHWLGTRVDVVGDFIPADSWASIENPDWLLKGWDDRGDRTIAFGVPMLPDSGGASLERGAAGDYDGHFRALARSLVAARQGDSVLRLGWEFNGGWFAWSADKCASCFRAYWRRIVHAMRGVDGAHFRFDWNPVLGRHAIEPQRAYPGDDVVDVIGLDVYDQADRPLNAAERWDAILGDPFGLRWHRAFARRHHKPISFPEWGLVDDLRGAGGDDPLFVTRMRDWIETNPTDYHVYFDVDVADGAHRLERFPAAQRAFRRAFG